MFSTAKIAVRADAFIDSWTKDCLLRQKFDENSKLAKDKKKFDGKYTCGSQTLPSVDYTKPLPKNARDTCSVLSPGQWWKNTRGCNTTDVLQQVKASPGMRIFTTFSKVPWFPKEGPASDDGLPECKDTQEYQDISKMFASGKNPCPLLPGMCLEDNSQQGWGCRKQKDLEELTCDCSKACKLTYPPDCKTSQPCPSVNGGAACGIGLVACVTDLNLYPTFKPQNGQPYECLNMTALNNTLPPECRCVSKEC